MRQESSGARWEAQPVRAAALRVAAFAVPLTLSVAAGIGVGALLPASGSLTSALTSWTVVLVVSTVVLRVVDRWTRRLLPVATLLKLSMLFPDQAPSRYKIARAAAGTKALAEELDRARQLGVSGDRQQAAETILALVGALGDYDSRTRGHSERTQLFVTMLAEEMKLKPEDRDRLIWAALVHDIGKLEVPGPVLNKPGKPDAAEWEVLRRHPVDGATICAPLMEWLGPWGFAIEQHHERYDGTGYPHGLKGEQISLAGRMVAVADSYEVMTAARPYKKPMTAMAAREELTRCAGSQFDPAVVRAFLAISLGRLRWIAGPLSWLAQLPFLRMVPSVGQAVGTAATGVLTGASLLGLGIGPLIGVATPAADAVASTAPPTTVRTHPTSTPSPTGHPTHQQPAITPTSTSHNAATANTPTSTAALPTPTSASTSTPTSSSSSSQPTPTPTTQPPPPTPVNHAPVAHPDTLQMNEEDPAHTVAVTANDTDADHDPLVVIAITQPAHGVSSLTGGAVQYTPNTGYHGSDSFTYTVSDGHGGTDTAPVSITVIAVNHPPVARADDYTVQVGTALNGNVLTNDSDPDDDPLQVTGDNSPTIAVAADGTFSYTPVSPGTTSFSYTLSDGSTTDTATVTITATAAPVTTSTLYLLGGSTLLTSPMSTTAPASAPTDWDLDGHPGLTIKDSDLKPTETDTHKYQSWSYATPAGGLTLNGPMSVNLWSSPHFKANQDLDYAAWVYNCDSLGGNCQLLTSAVNIHVTKWSTTTTWEQRTLPLGSVTQTLTAGRTLRVRLAFHRSDLWLALDQNHPSSLQLTQ